MREENAKALIELFNGNGTDEETGNEIFKNVDYGVNSFGASSEKMRELYESLTAFGKKRFQLIFLISMLSLAFEWIRGNYDCWDLRKKNSMMFAYNNLTEFENLFNKLTDLKLNVSSLTPDTLERHFFPTYFKNYLWETKGIRYYEPSEYSYLIAWSDKWQSMHSTLKQTYVRNIVNGILLYDNPDHGFNGNSEYDSKAIVFPFI